MLWLGACAPAPYNFNLISCSSVSITHSKCRAIVEHAMTERSIRITELDEAGNLIATFVQSAGSKDGYSRVDTIARLSLLSFSTSMFAKSRTVSGDYQVVMAEIA